MNIDIQEQIKAMSGMPDLHTSDQIDEGIELSFTAKEYGTIEQIVNHLQSGKKPQHVYSESLRQNGHAVQESMEKYLADERFGSSVLKAALRSELHLLFSQSDDKEELEKLEGEKDYFNIGEYLHQCLLEPTKFGRAIVEPSYSLASHDGCDTAIDYWSEMARKIALEKVETGDEEEVLEAGEDNDPRNKLDKIVNDFMDKETEPDKKGNTHKLGDKKDYIQKLRAFCDLTPVTEENYLKIQILKKHYESYGVSEYAPNGLIERLLKHSKREISMYFDPYKIRPDALQFEENIGVNAVISVKSTAREDLRAYYSHQAKLHYDLSESMYLDIASKITGRNFNTVINIMLQTVKPYGVAVLVWSPEDLEVGHYKYQVAKSTLDRCMGSGIYRSYDMYAEEGHLGMIQMKLPGWNEKQLLEVNMSDN